MGTWVVIGGQTVAAADGDRDEETDGERAAGLAEGEGRGDVVTAALAVVEGVPVPVDELEAV